VLAAQLHGKLTRTEEDLEDLLTSNVFGSFEYIPPEDGLVPLLMNSIKQDLRNCPFKNIGRISDVNYEFWTTLDEPTCVSCEPDVIINFIDEKKNKIIVLVEAKYRSGKSSESELKEEKPYDQLAKEWDNLIHLAMDNNAKPYLLFITADIVFPFEDVESSQSAFRRTRGKRNTLDIVWISWRKLPTLFRDSKYKILRDVATILRNQGLIFFEGFKVESIKSHNWIFESKIKKLPLIERKFDWQLSVPSNTWKYDNININNWNVGRLKKSNWRYKNE
jgi:hypothetical protein